MLLNKISLDTFKFGIKYTVDINNVGIKNS